jgi:hypothetical protein
LTILEIHTNPEFSGNIFEKIRENYKFVRDVHPAYFQNAFNVNPTTTKYPWLISKSDISEV